MKRYGFYLILILLMICTVNVNASGTNTYTYWYCSNTSSINCAEYFTSGSSGLTRTEGIVYNIAEINITGDILTLYGWAFNKGVDNDLGGTGGTSYPTDITFVFSTSSSTSGITSSNSVYLDVTYAPTYNENNSSGLRWYNLTFWNCVRSSGNNLCYSSSSTNDTVDLIGGFSASIDLSNEKITSTTNQTWYLYMKVNTNSGAELDNTWNVVGVDSDVIGVDDINDYNNKTDNVITISNLSNQAKMVASNARLLTSDGSIAISEYDYFRLNAIYTISGDRSSAKACKGYCNSNAYYQPLYILKTKSTYSTYHDPGSDESKYYAPASWLQFTKQLTLKTSAKVEEDPVTPQYCSEGTTYTNYYLFLGALDDSTTNLNNSAGNSTYNDGEILASLNAISNSYLDILSEGIYTINSTNLYNASGSNLFSKGYYAWLTKALNSSKYYASETITVDGKEVQNYYILHSSWTDSNTGKTYSTKSNFALSEGVTSSNYQSVLNATVAATTLTIQKGQNSSNLGYTFSVSRTFDSTKIKMGSVSSATKYNGYYYSPAVYYITYCVSDEIVASCEDDISGAVCYSSDVGTEAYFHESNSLKACTLNENEKESGFTLRSSNYDTTTYGTKVNVFSAPATGVTISGKTIRYTTSDGSYNNTTTSNSTTSYGTVACKENINLEFPTKKYAYSGSYFVLDSYIPTITATRTCVTTKIDYDQLLADIDVAVKDLEFKYKVYQDLLYIYNHLDGEELSTTSGHCHCGTDYCDDYTKYPWKIYSVTNTPNKIVTYSGKSGSKYTGCKTSGTWFDDALDSVQDTYEALVNNAGDAYDNAYQILLKLIIAYENMYDWVDDYEYSINPTLTFTYEDEYNSLFTSNNLKGNLDSSSSNTYYWSYDTTNEPDEEYNGTGDSTKATTNSSNKITYTYYTCNSGTSTDLTTSCSSIKTNTASITVNTNTYIKRVETRVLSYKLPTVYSSIPSGIVSLTSSTNSLSLETNAVPININTIANDNYIYTIKVSNIVDTVRSNSKSNVYKSSDNFASRFSSFNAAGGSAFTGNTYTCYYKIVSDIYNPDPDGDGNSDDGTLGFFYRVIDMSNINPNNRELGYNWTSEAAQEVIARMKSADSNYQILTGASSITN